MQNQAINMRRTGRLAERLAACLAEMGRLNGDEAWTELLGGRTNRLWRITGPMRDEVCKLYSTDAGTPLFPNDPEAECAALRALADRGMAPELVAFVETPEGPCLIYRHLDPVSDHVGPEQVARRLRELHMLPVPPGPWRNAARLTEPGDRALPAIGAAERQKLERLRPAPDIEAVDPVLLHGDPVPANVIARPDGPVFIDWQCPSIGDPCDDLAIVLSPAMQALYGGLPIDVATTDAVLAAYGCEETAARYRRLAPAYHWRMAAHCLLKAVQGDRDYTAAAELELARLE